MIGGFLQTWVVENPLTEGGCGSHAWMKDPPKGLSDNQRLPKSNYIIDI